MKKLWRRIGNKKKATQNKLQELEPEPEPEPEPQPEPQPEPEPEPEPARAELVLLGNLANRFDLDDLLRSSAEVLGKGTVGTTYKAQLEDETTVVVKRFKDAVLSAEDFRDMVVAVGAIEHENLLPLRGYYCGKDEKFLLYDYMPLGSLSSQLHGSRTKEPTPLSWEVRLSIAHGVAQAIEHLHAQRHPKIHHGNIKSSNVLLTPSYGRVSDYGLDLLRSSALVGGADPTMADVYGFGVLLLELLTRKPPAQALLNEEGQGVDLPTWVQSIVREDWTAEVFDLELMRYHNIEEGMFALLEVAISCVSPNLPKRPRMSEVRRKIEELCSPGEQRDGASQPDRVNEGTKDTSSSLIPNAQGDGDSQLHQFSEVSHYTDTRRPLNGVLEVFERVYAYLLENVLMLGLDQIDVPWDRHNQFSGDFIAEITFSEMNPSASLVSVDSSSDEEQKENQLAKGAGKFGAQELQVEDQAVYHALPSRDANTSHEENEVREWPIQSDSAFPTSILQTTLPSRLEASVHSAFDGSSASSESAFSLLSQDGSSVSFSAMPTKKNIEPLQSPKQHLVSSLDSSQDVYPGENTESARWERIAAVTETNMEINSVSEPASLSAVNDGSVESTAAGASNSAQLPDMMLPKLKNLYQQEGSPSLTSMSSGYDYDVFLSFRGPDTRSGITSVLYTKLVDARIRTFKDDEELRVGEEFGPELLKAINQSKIAIPIFSKGYVSSKWCLSELVQMVECSKTRRQKIMPIFYDVTPTEVRHQIGSYEEAFLSHKEKFGGNDNKWEAALSHAANLSGWDNSKKNRGEGELVDEIVQKVIDELKMEYLLVTNCLVGVESHVKEIDTIMCGDSDDIRILGIHGMGGVGKTTLAKIIYNRLSHDFESCCFLSNIKETSEFKGIECLQNQLISKVLKKQWSNINNVEEGIKTIKDRLCGKKVLVLLDDVDQMTHWDALIGKPAWFGLGSRIIITSRNRDIVEASEVCYPYELSSMDFNQSLQLFCKHAFGRDYPLDDYIAFSTAVVQSTGYLPLALEAIGKLLPKRSKDVWDEILEKLKQVPLADVKRKLKISYDALDDRQKRIFLEIASLDTGLDRSKMLPSWRESNLFPEEGLEFLRRMSLITIDKDNKLWMHDQLRGLGRDIVRQERDKEPKKKTQLWNHAEGLDMVMEMKGTKNVEALCRKFDPQSLSKFANEEIKRLSHLRYCCQICKIKRGISEDNNLDTCIIQR